MKGRRALLGAAIRATSRKSGPLGLHPEHEVNDLAVKNATKATGRGTARRLFSLRQASSLMRPRNDSATRRPASS